MVQSIELELPDAEIELIRAPSGAVLLDHMHPDVHFLVVLEGMIDEQGCNYAAGDVRVSPKNDRHFLRFNRASTCLLIRGAERFRDLPVTKRWSAAVPRAADCARELVEAVRHNHSSKAASFSHRMLTSIRDEYERALSFPPAWLREMHSYVSRELEAVPPIRHLARSVGVTREHLSRSFRKHYHVGLATFLQHRRIENAYRRIRSTNCELASIAFECGFADQSHMTREFGGCFGITPGRLRAPVARNSITSIQDTSAL
jgi:AraC-like DNA-binding protein